MSAHSFVPVMRRSTGLLVLSIFSGLLMALQLLIPSIAFASVSRSATGHDLSPQQQEALDLAGVSVVRLVVTYTVAGTSSKTSTVTCTGLGTIVGSGSATGSSDQMNWVLTDSSLVHLSGPTCNKTQGQLASIAIFPNTIYSNALTPPKYLGIVSCTPAVCQDTATGTASADSLQPATETFGSAALFSFHTDQQHPQPFVAVGPSNTNSTAQELGIELANGSATSDKWPQSPFVVATSGQQPTQFLVPNAITSSTGNLPGSVAPTATTTVTSSPTPGLPAQYYEPGMPVVGVDGTLIGMYTSGNTQVSLTQINKLMQTPLPATLLAQFKRTNVLYTNWQTGIQDYYANNFQGAHTALSAIASINPEFKAAGIFDATNVVPRLSKNGNNATATPTATGNAGSGTILGFPAQQVILAGIVAVVIILVLILIVVSLTFGRARARRKREEMAQFEADQAEAQRIADMEEQRQQAKITARLQSPFSTVRCPNCGAQVTADDTVCPNCRYLLSASDSGLHLRAVPPPMVESPPQMSPVQAFSGMAPSPSISEMPTMQFSPSNGTVNDGDKTQPYNIQQLQGFNLSLAVGARTDRGIKRQHKPNEDNYFALQAPRPSRTLPQEFGLFVVADGMGGHANGQDASRLAIQTIIDFMLPSLASSNPMSEEDFKNLLTEGVQHANQAVHQRNMDERADMGTTMTAALIVGAIAYVANVGDSRTYLYREPEGLVKITHDHSVVASLVDAGIIKPDDIYTHPKRNQIYRSLGEKPYVEVDTFKVSLQVGDKLLLCSDGLWDMVRDPEIQRVMSTPMPDPTKTGKALIQAALDGGGEDNVSVIVVSINEMSSQPTISGIQLIAKPETVNLPELPQMGA